MPDLREVLESMGHSAVSTYIQSGNVVFDSTERKSSALGTQIEGAIARSFGLKIDVVVRSARELHTAMAANPFLDSSSGNTALHVVFLSDAPDAARLATIDRTRFAPEEFAIGRREVYLHLPDGIGRSKLTAALGPKLAPSIATVRNWNTVTKLAEMAKR